LRHVRFNFLLVHKSLYLKSIYNPHKAITV